MLSTVTNGSGTTRQADVFDIFDLNNLGRGNPTVTAGDLVVGPDGAFYVADILNNAICPIFLPHCPVF